MKLEEILTPQMIFKPDSFYDGGWNLGGDSIETQKDLLYLNSKIVNNKNLYIEFLNKYYFKPLSEMLKITSLESFYPSIVFDVDKKLGERSLKFSLFTFISEQIFTLLNQENIDELLNLHNKEITDEELIEFVKEKIREDKKKYSHALQNGTESPYYNILHEIYKKSGIDKKFDFETFLNRRINAETNLLIGSKYYKSLFNKEINVDELLKCFDYDIFCLTIAKSAIDVCLDVEKYEGKVYNIINYLYFYTESVKIIKQSNPNYNCKINYRDQETDKLITTNSNELIKEYESLLSRHPEFSFLKYNVAEIKDFLKTLGFDENFIDKFRPDSLKGGKIVNEFYKLKKGANTELKASWIFIRKGEKDPYETPLPGDSNYKPDNNYILHNNKRITEEEKIRKMLYCKTFFENSNYIYKIFGINKFEGYIGYIYPNGRVVMEKFYDDIKNKKVSTLSATYIMNIYNFIEISKLNKIEIIDLIMNNPSSNIYRVYHVKNIKNWAAKVSQYISGNDYTKDVISYIDNLINKNTISKGGKHGFN